MEVKASVCKITIFGRRGKAAQKAPAVETGESTCENERAVGQMDELFGQMDRSSGQIDEPFGQMDENGLGLMNELF